MSDVTTEFYASLIDQDLEIVEEIISAANFLDIRGLVALGCAKMGTIIRDKTVAEFREIFKIENDFTPEEEA